MQTGAQGMWGSQHRPPQTLEGVLEYPRAGECLVHPSVAESPQLGLEVRAPGLQPTSPVVTTKGTGGAGAAGSPVRVRDRILSASEAGTTTLPMTGDWPE